CCVPVASAAAAVAAGAAAAAAPSCEGDPEALCFRCGARCGRCIGDACSADTVDSSSGAKANCVTLPPPPLSVLTLLDARGRRDCCCCCCSARAAARAG